MGDIKAALDELNSQNLVVYAQTAKKFGANKTTFARCHKGEQKSRKDVDREYKFLLTHEQKKYLVSYINKLTDYGIPPTTSMVRNLAGDIAKKQPGSHWVSRFNKRWEAKLCSGYLVGADSSRTKADNTVSYKAYFELVIIPKYIVIIILTIQIVRKIAKYNVQPCNIYNVHEKGFLIGVLQKMHRVFGLSQVKSGKLLGAGQYGSREWITLLARICQDLTALPPMCIYSSTSGDVMDSWVDDFNPDEHEGFFSSSETG
jgi:hypothetical protein